MVPFLSRFLCVKEGEEGVVVLLVAAFLRSKRNAGVIFSAGLSVESSNINFSFFRRGIL